MWCEKTIRQTNYDNKENQLGWIDKVMGDEHPIVFTGRGIACR